MLEDVFAPYLAEAGAELELVCLPMPELLEYYYGLKERDCDMILLGTNLSDVFDPSGDYNADGYNRLNGITDPELQQMTIDMRQTEPGDSFGYVQKWIKYIERKAALCTEIPLYSNAYMDFFTAALQNYAPGNYSSWAEAVQHAVLTDYVEEEEAEDVFDEEEEEGEDDIFLD